MSTRKIIVNDEIPRMSRLNARVLLRDYKQILKPPSGGIEKLLGPHKNEEH